MKTLTTVLASLACFATHCYAIPSFTLTSATDLVVIGGSPTDTGIFTLTGIDAITGDVMEITRRPEGNFQSMQDGFNRLRDPGGSLAIDLSWAGGSFGTALVNGTLLTGGPFDRQAVTSTRTVTIMEPSPTILPSVLPPVYSISVPITLTLSEAFTPIEGGGGFGPQVAEITGTLNGFADVTLTPDTFIPDPSRHSITELSYRFTTSNNVAAVPEPTSFVVWGLLIAVGMLVSRRRLAT